MDQQPTTPTPPQSSSNAKILVIGGIILIVAGIGVYLYSKPAPVPSETPQVVTPQPLIRNPDIGNIRRTTGDGQSSPPPAPTPAPVTTTGGTYKDGTYSAEGDYDTHAGPEAIQLTVTLKHGVITDTSFTATPNAPMSGRYMDVFNANYKQYVVGQNIADVNLGPISGSSLTPMGFNDAIAKIKAQAQS